jgi:hypothetical protein
MPACKVGKLPSSTATKISTIESVVIKKSDKKGSLKHALDATVDGLN